VDLILSKEQIKAFSKAMEANKDALHILKLQYLAAQIRENELKEMFDSVYNEILVETDYRVSAEKNPKRMGLKVGDRITNEIDTFLMSDADYEVFLLQASNRFYSLGYTDEQGNYKEGYNGTMIRLEAENKLIDFQLSILPENLQAALKGMKTYTARQKFLNLIMGQ
jgi:hypothetical protein